MTQEHPGTPFDAVEIAPFRVGLDWLTLSMRGPLKLLDYTEPTAWHGPNGESFTWIPTPHRTSVHDRVFYLHDQTGEKLLTVAAGCGKRAKVLNQSAEWMLVQFENRTLYDGTFEALYGQLCAMGFVYLAISRIDVAADGFAGNGGDFQQVVQRTWGGEFRYFGKADWRPRMSRGGKVTGCELGTRSSNKFLRCYNKSKELKLAHSMHKAAYIKAAWESAIGGPATGDVNRLEIQVKGKEVRRYFPEEGDRDFPLMLADNRLLVDMFASMVPKVYDFRTNTGRARNAELGVRWNFANVCEGLDLRDRAKKSVALSPQGLKITIRNLWVVGMTSQQPGFLHSAQAMADSSGLGRWYNESQVRWKAHADKVEQSHDRLTRSTIAAATAAELSDDSDAFKLPGDYNL